MCINKMLKTCRCSIHLSYCDRLFKAVTGWTRTTDLRIKDVVLNAFYTFLSANKFVDKTWIVRSNVVLSAFCSFTAMHNKVV